MNKVWRKTLADANSELKRTTRIALIVNHRNESRVQAQVNVAS